jgi:hypothetical protein
VWQRVNGENVCFVARLQQPWIPTQLPNQRSNSSSIPQHSGYAIRQPYTCGALDVTN